MQPGRSALWKVVNTDLKDVNCVVGGQEIRGYCFGDVEETGTALIIVESERLLLYTPEDAFDPGWSGLNGQQSAFVVINGGKLELQTVSSSSRVCI